MTYLVGVLGLALLVLIHEAGHFFTARAVGMSPRRFYVGFPPALVKVRRKGIEYGIGAIPLGGYVKIPGMHRPAPSDLDVHFGRAIHEAPRLVGVVEHVKRPIDAGEFETARAELEPLERAVRAEQLSPAARRGVERGLRDLRDGLGADAYWRQATWKRVAVIFAGPATNLVFAVLLLAMVFMLGVRQTTLEVANVVPASPAELAGLEPGDHIVAVNGNRVTAFVEVAEAIDASDGKRVTLTVRRERALRTLEIMPTQRWPQRDAVVGFEPGFRYERRSVDDAFGRALSQTWEVTVAIGGSVGRLVRGSGRDELASPVGIVQVSSQALAIDFRFYLQLLAFISLSLALLNLLPLLPLDGGHIAFSLVEAVRRRAVGRDVYERVSIVGIALVLVLFMIGLSNDLGGRGPG